MSARPAAPLTGFPEQLEVFVPLHVGNFPAIQGRFNRAIHAGVRLEEMDHPGANGKREHHKQKIPTMVIGKLQHRSGFTPLQESAKTRSLLRVDQRPDKRQHRTDQGNFSSPVRNDARPFMGEFFKEVNLVEREGLGQRIKKKITERDVDFGHVEHQKNDGCAGQWNTEVEVVKTHGITHWLVTERQSEASI
ncbi:hypothetical protein D3C84_577230 [compost metagenome]